MSLLSYMTSTEADTIAAEMISAHVAAYTAATTGDKTAALKQATTDIDNAMRYQGQKYDLITPQVLEFPRIPYGTPAVFGGPPILNLTNGINYQVWDWDYTNNVAVVPLNVKMAVIHQANALLLGKRDRTLDKQHDGVAGHKAGQLEEQFDTNEEPSTLCRRAFDIMMNYRLRTGQMR